jgi:hypothetical protein
MTKINIIKDVQQITMGQCFNKKIFCEARWSGIYQQKLINLTNYKIKNIRVEYNYIVNEWEIVEILLPPTNARVKINDPKHLSMYNYFQKKEDILSAEYYHQR